MEETLKILHNLYIFLTSKDDLKKEDILLLNQARLTLNAYARLLETQLVEQIEKAYTKPASQ